MLIILKNNYFYINGSFIHQIKGTDMGTHATVLCANLTCGYLEVKLFDKLLEIFSDEIVEFFLKKTRFLDGAKWNWKESIYVPPLWELMNSLDPDIVFLRKRFHSFRLKSINF